MGGVLTAWLAEMVVITYRGVEQGRYVDNPIPHLPLPSEYVGAAIIYGGLSMFSGRAARPAQVFAWGVVLATVLNLWSPAPKGTGVVVKGQKSPTGTAPVVSPTPGGSK